MLFETESIADAGGVKKNMVVNPDDLSGLMRMRDKYQALFKELFPDHGEMLEGDWKIRSFVRMCA